MFAHEKTAKGKKEQGKFNTSKIGINKTTALRTSAGSYFLAMQIVTKKNILLQGVHLYYVLH